MSRIYYDISTWYLCKSILKLYTCKLYAHSVCCKILGTSQKIVESIIFLKMIKMSAYIYIDIF